MDYLDWDSLGKQFYLLDTFRGMDERFIFPRRQASGAVEEKRADLASGFYVQGIEAVRANFFSMEKCFLSSKDRFRKPCRRFGQKKKIAYLASRSEMLGP